MYWSYFHNVLYKEEKFLNIEQFFTEKLNLNQIFKIIRELGCIFCIDAKPSFSKI
jgi:hypothetical protein